MEAKGTKHDGGLSLPEDIVFDVLARLPTKALCQLRCVCKGWRALISDRAFVAGQRSRAADPHLVGVFSGSRYLPEVRVMDMAGNVVKAFEVAMSTPLPPQLPTRPDLICADGWNGDIIIDPAAGEAFAAFGTSYPVPSSMSYSTIFGRAAPSGVFKVLRLQEPFLMNDGNGGDHQLCEVATVMDGSGGGAAELLTWRPKSAPPFVITGELKAIVNGVIYFIHEVEIDDDVDLDDVYFILSSNLIVAFDLESEEWKAEAINVPALEHQEGEGTWSIALAELNGTLAFVHEVLVNRYPCTSIWLLTDPDKSVWVNEYVIPMPKNHIAPAKPLGALVDGRILLWSSVLENEETWEYDLNYRRPRKVVLLYDPSTKAITDFVEMTKGFRDTLVLYTGSLLSCRQSNVGKHL